MKRALINPEKCLSCQPCQVAEKCPMHAILRETAEDKPWVDFYHCSGCAKCKAFCPHRAIHVLTHPCDGGRRMGW